MDQGREEDIKVAIIKINALSCCLENADNVIAVQILIIYGYPFEQTYLSKTHKNI